MTARPSLTDEALKAMLGRRASRSRPEGLHDTIMSGVATTAQQQRQRLPRPSWPVLGLVRRQQAWVVALIVLLVLAAVTAIAGSRLLEPRPQLDLTLSKLVPSGIELLSGDRGMYTRTVADRDGSVWTIGAGHLVRYDPATGSGRSWSIVDDLRFDGRSIIAARTGGVWVVGDRTIQRFDGAAFRDTIDLGFDVRAATESHDGSLWVASPEGAVLHLIGGSRTLISAPRPDPIAQVCAIAVDASDNLWLGWDGYPERSWVARYDGAAWSTFDEADAAPLADNVAAFAVPPDGSIWVGTGAGVARFADAAWTVPSDRDGFPGTGTLAVAVAGEPTVISGRVGDDVTAVRVADRVFAGSSAGLFEVRAGVWDRVWPDDQSAGPAPFAGGSIPSLVALSQDEVWQDYGGQTWHYLNGAWASVRLQDAGTAASRRAADGTLWPCRLDQALLAGQSVATSVEAAETTACTRTLDGTGLLFAMSEDSAGPGGWAVRTFAADAAGWTEVGRTPPTTVVLGPGRVGVTADGSIWVGGQGAWGTNPGLARYVDGRWQRVRPRGDTGFVVNDLLVTRDGDLWLAAQDLVDPPDSAEPWPLGDAWVARFDGTDWTVYRAADVLRSTDPLVQGSALIWDLSAGPDGSIWAATDHGLARFDGIGWKTHGPSTWFGAVSVASDGTVWASGTWGIARIRDGPGAR